MECYYDNLNKKLDKLQNKQQSMRKTKTNQQRNQFYPRTVNLTKIKFNQGEMSLLNKGLQHSIEKPLEKYWTDLIMETEQAIRLLEPKLQSAYRILATRKLKQIKTSSNHHNAEAKRQTYVLKNINNKLRKEDAMITKADKGKTCVIIYNNDYASKVHNFLANNNFQKLPKDTTDKYQKNITSTLKHCNLIINKKQMRHLIQKKPLPPSLNVKIKIHKPNNPIRPVVNNRNAPSYKIATFLENKLYEHLNLEYQYNVKVSTSLANNLTKLKIDENHRMITFDITDLYVNIPITETLAITKHLFSEHNDEHITTQMLMLLETVLQQNYFSFQNSTYQSEKGCQWYPQSPTLLLKYSYNI